MVEPQGTTGSVRISRAMGSACADNDRTQVLLLAGTPKAVAPA